MIAAQVKDRGPDYWAVNIINPTRVGSHPKHLLVFHVLLRHLSDQTSRLKVIVCQAKSNYIFCMKLSIATMWSVTRLINWIEFCGDSTTPGGSARCRPALKRMTNWILATALVRRRFRDEGRGPYHRPESNYRYNVDRHKLRQIAESSEILRFIGDDRSTTWRNVPRSRRHSASVGGHPRGRWIFCSLRPSSRPGPYRPINSSHASIHTEFHTRAFLVKKTYNMPPMSVAVLPM
jgi:hypothetical protein